MGCRRSIPFASACALETCTTAARTDSGHAGADVVNEKSLCFAPDLCYAMVQTWDAAFTEFYISKYDPATNALVQKATRLGGDLLGRWTYAASHKLFVSASGTDIFLYDPITETIDSFASGVATGVIQELVYVPQKGFVYGEMGTDGTGLNYIGYVDLDLRIVVQLGTIPAFGPSKPRPYNLVYVPVNNCLYGCWATGLNANVAKFNLTTNIGVATIAGGVEGVEMALDTDRNLLIASLNQAHEIDPTTDALVRSTAIAPGTALAYTPFYSSALKKVVGISTGRTVTTYNTLTYATTDVFTDFTYYGLRQLKDGSVLTNAYDAPKDGVRRLCVT